MDTKTQTNKPAKKRQYKWKRKQTGSEARLTQGSLSFIEGYFEISPQRAMDFMRLFIIEEGYDVCPVL